MLRYMLAGFAAGAVTGLFGAGGGMVLIPLLTLLRAVEDKSVFPTSVSIILPVCVTAILTTHAVRSVDFAVATAYLCGSAAGGFFAGIWGQKIPVKWLHRGLGVLILWGGIRYLC